jgi:acetoin utilization deacetylase AcuC-like enzyme
MRKGHPVLAMLFTLSLFTPSPIHAVKIFYTDHYVLPLPAGHRFPMAKYSLLRTHHAFRDHGEGYCVFNDSAIAALSMQAEGCARRVAILDCDVHQGNGTASILADEPIIFTFSIHAAKNFPFRKEASDLDIEMPDGVGDADYLDALEQGICHALAAAQPDLAIYLAGADPYVGDRLGRLSLTKEGLQARDRKVFELCRAASVPVAVAMAGGYSNDIADSVDIHFCTVETAGSFWRAAQRPTSLPAARQI